MRGDIALFRLNNFLPIWLLNLFENATNITTFIKPCHKTVVLVSRFYVEKCNIYDKLLFICLKLDIDNVYACVK